MERKTFKWNNRQRTRRCLICGAEFTTIFARQKFCGSPECAKKRLAVKNERRKGRRHLLASLGFPIHSKGNK